jgi:cell division protein FtsB
MIMTKAKMTLIITASVAAAMLLFVFLSCFLIYQWITIAVYNNRIEKAQENIAAYEQKIEESSNELEYKSSDLFKQIEAFKLGLIEGNK